MLAEMTLILFVVVAIWWIIRLERRFRSTEKAVISEMRATVERMCDESYLEGLKAGWNCGVDEDTERFELIKRSIGRELEKTI